MPITVSSSAFDAVLEDRPGLLIWVVAGYVSDTVCGFDLRLVGSDADPETLDVFSTAMMWWGTDSPRAPLSLGLTVDGVPVELTIAEGGASAGAMPESVSAHMSVQFTTPAAGELLFTSSAPAWHHQASVRFDTDVLAESLARWERQVARR
jgi:hypothetical protein